MEQIADFRLAIADCENPALRAAARASPSLWNLALGPSALAAKRPVARALSPKAPLRRSPSFPSFPKSLWERNCRRNSVARGWASAKRGLVNAPDPATQSVGSNGIPKREFGNEGVEFAVWRLVFGCLVFPRRAPFWNFLLLTLWNLFGAWNVDCGVPPGTSQRDVATGHWTVTH